MHHYNCLFVLCKIKKENSSSRRKYAAAAVFIALILKHFKKRDKKTAIKMDNGILSDLADRGCQIVETDGSGF